VQQDAPAGPLTIINPGSETVEVRLELLNFEGSAVNGIVLKSAGMNNETGLIAEFLSRHAGSALHYLQIQSDRGVIVEALCGIRNTFRIWEAPVLSKRN
jgi:hypothetical protein